MKCRDCAYFSYITSTKCFRLDINTGEVRPTLFNGICKYECDSFTKAENESCCCFTTKDERDTYENDLFDFLQKELSDYYEDLGDDLTIIEIPQKEIGNNKYDFNI